MMIEKIFNDYYEALCLYAFKLTKDHSLAEDVVQDAFFVLFKNEHIVKLDATDVVSYLYGTVRNMCLNQFRREKVIERYWQKVSYADKVDAKFDMELIYSEVLTSVYKIIENMPEGCAKVFRLGYLEGLSNKEVAEKLNISTNTVKTQKRRGMIMLRKNLNPEFLPLVLYFLF